MSKQLYLECASGISGDMTVAALLDLGADKSVLLHALESLPVSGYTIRISRVKKSGLDCCDFSVLLDAAHENHDHDMEYLHGHEHHHGHEEEACHDHEHHHDHEEEACHDHEHSHSHEEEACHDHEHSHDHEEEACHDHEHSHDHEEEACHIHEHHHEVMDQNHHHHHEHRGLPEIFAILDAADLTDSARNLAKKIFDIIGDAEAKAHGVPKDQVHFHEVGAVDSIVDITAAAVCIDNLGITETIVPALSEGCGTIRCQHGILPVPVPAVLNIVQAHKLTLRMTGVRGELVTPTGAAIAAALRTSDKLPESFVVHGVGLGAGKRKNELPGILRAMLIESRDTVSGPRQNAESDSNTDFIWKLESNIDDSTGEELGFIMDLLMKKGARDVHYTPVYMKKNRPAYQLNVICTEGKREELEQLIFYHTSTIGIRRTRMERSILEREEQMIETGLGTARVKVVSIDGQARCYPEYNSVKALSEETNMPIREVYEEIRRVWSEKNPCLL